MKLRQMIEGATQGPWYAIKHPEEDCLAVGIGTQAGFFAGSPITAYYPNPKENAELIVAFLNNAPALADLADASRTIFLEHCKDVGDNRGDGCEICVAYQKLSEEFQP